MPTNNPKRAGSGLRDARLRIAEKVAVKSGFESYAAMRQQLGEEATDNLVDEHMDVREPRVRGERPQGTMTSGLPGYVGPNWNDDE